MTEEKNNLKTECKHHKTHENAKENKVLNYFKNLPKRYFITAFSGMAQGLFVTLIAGTILATVAEKIIGLNNYIGQTIFYIACIAKTLMGAGIGVGIAHALSKGKLLVFSASVAGFIGAFADKLLFGSFMQTMFPAVSSGFSSVNFGAPGNPIGAYVVVMLAVEIVGLYEGKTKLDIILIPLGTLFLSFAGVYVAWPFIKLIDLFAELLVIFPT